MRAEIVGLTRYAEKNSPAEALYEARLLDGGGLEGDRHTDCVSVLTEDARLWRDSQAETGLCFPKFRENVRVRVAPGAACTGELAAVLRVTENKRCYADCTLFTSGGVCRLATGAFLAAVERGGAVRIGDTIEIEGL